MVTDRRETVMYKCRGLPRFLLCIGTSLLLAAIGVRVGAQADQSVPSTPTRLQEMQHHFLQATLVYEAVIRGDLAATRQPAAELAALPMPAGLPTAARPFVDNINLAGRRALEAPTLDLVAVAAAALLAQCGACHSAVGVVPTPVSREYPDVGGLVGHMLEHQRAADELLQGLVIPSDGLWRQGAERLRAAPLSRSDLPDDPELTAEIREAEVAVHALADRATSADSITGRASLYLDLTTTCARCHELHRQIWGPNTLAP
jgi:cytochrome c553